ncbi:hypothetical protein Tco_0360832 [Tanacetum coccineum]
MWLKLRRGTGERKGYDGLLHCAQCKLHHNGPWHYRSDFPGAKNRNHGIQAEVRSTVRLMPALGGGEADQTLTHT